MRRPVLQILLGVAVAVATQPAGAGEAAADKPKAAEVDMSKLTHVIDNPFVAFASLKRAVYGGKAFDSDNGKPYEARVECNVREKPEKIAGIMVTVVEVSDFEDGELVEKTLDYYAQDAAGNVYYIGEKVDDFENGKLVGHGGQWLTGQKGAKPGLFMTAAPKVGDVLEQERAPGVAEDRSVIIAVGVKVTVPAGTYENCIETEDYDPIGKTTQRKYYAPGVGLLKEIFVDGKSTVELLERKSVTPHPGS